MTFWHTLRGFWQRSAANSKLSILHCAGKDLPPSVVREAFTYSLEHDAPLCGFLGDTCVTLRRTDELMVGPPPTHLPSRVVLRVCCNRGNLGLLPCLWPGKVWALQLHIMYCEKKINCHRPIMQDMVTKRVLAQELHAVYYEPLAGVAASVEDILQGPPVKKLLFMTDAGRVDAELKPHWMVGASP